MEGGYQHSPLDPTDLLAVIILAFVSMRRLSVKVMEAESYPHVPRREFTQWREQTLKAHAIVALACLLKVVVNNAWYFGARGRVSPPVLASVGIVLFLLWAVALIVGWYRAARASQRRAELGILPGGAGRTG